VLRIESRIIILSYERNAQRKSGDLVKIKRLIAAVALLTGAGVLTSACGVSPNSSKSSPAKTTAPGNGKSPGQSTTTTIESSSPSNLRANYNLCTNPAINALIEKELNISPANLHCFNNSSYPDITDAQWENTTLQNGWAVEVVFDNNNNPEGSSDQFAADLNLASQSSSQGAPLYMSLPPNIDGLPAIWRGGTRSLEVKDGNYIIRVDVSNPSNESLAQQISTELLPLIVQTAFN